MKKLLIPKLLCLCLISFSSVSMADKSKLKEDGSLQTDIRIGDGMTITSIYHPLEDFDPKEPLEPQTLTRTTLYQYPTVPLAGFSPYVAIALSNKREYDEFDFEHNLEYKYTLVRL